MYIKHNSIYLSAELIVGEIVAKSPHELYS